MTSSATDVQEQVAPGAGQGATHDAGTRAELRRKTIRGAFLSCLCQGANFVLRTGSMMVLARLLSPRDFGLFGMVSAITGFLGLFKEAGLSTAAIQSATVTEGQQSVLFWVNVLVGLTLAVLCAVGGPLVATFYGEPKLTWIMLATAGSFIFTGLAAQHRAMLMRDLRFGAVAGIDVLSFMISIAASIAMAATGFGYWALVASAVLLPATSALGAWLVSGWLPGAPRWHSGLRPMLTYGGTITVNSIVVYLAYNAEKVLLGRFLGAEALGIYGRAYQLVSIPSENLQSTIGAVAFPALSRLQADGARFKSYFLRGYNLFLSLAFPITLACALFAEDIVRVFLGAKWHDAVPIFRLLTPTIVAFALINPFGWLLYANGRVMRSLKIAFMIAPVVILADFIGLQWGATGVAIGFSAAMLTLVIPVISWAKHDTAISVRDVIRVITYPAGAALAAGAAAMLAKPWLTAIHSAFVRLVAESAVFFAVYAIMLAFVFGQKRMFLELAKDAQLWPRKTETAKAEQPA